MLPILAGTTMTPMHVKSRQRAAALGSRCMCACVWVDGCVDWLGQDSQGVVEKISKFPENFQEK